MMESSKTTVSMREMVNNLFAEGVSGFISRAPLWVRVVISGLFWFILAFWARFSDGGFFVLWIFISLGVTVWAILGVFRRDTIIVRGGKHHPRMNKIFAFIFVAVPVLLVGGVQGYNLALAISPYSAEEIAEQEAAKAERAAAKAIADAERQAERERRATEEIGLSHSDDVSVDGIKNAVLTMFPDCAFEEFSVKNGDQYSSKNGDKETALAWQLMTIDEWSAEGGVFEFSAADPDFEGFTNFLACHSKGRPFALVQESGGWTAPIREDGSSWITMAESGSWGPTGAAKDCDFFSNWENPTEDFVDSCASVMADADNTGVVVLIRLHTSPAAAQEHLSAYVQRVKNSSYDRPRAAVGSFSIRFLGPFEWMSYVGIRTVDVEWETLLSGFDNSVQGSDVDSTFGKSHDKGDKSRGIIFIRMYFEEFTTCNDPLLVSELDWNSGQCGTAAVKIFQADLATGKCAFLGTYEDKDGVSRTGLFYFCDRFLEGSFSEGKRYSLKLSVSGETSYTTRGGSERQVLAFDVIG